VEKMGETAGNGKERAVTRQYGVLATSLNEALDAARGALEPHSLLLPDGRMGELDALLAEFARRRMRIAIYGEVKAGKSTLINAIAGTELSPVAFEPLTSIPVRVTYGSPTVWRVGDRVVDNIDALSDIMRETEGGPEVVVETDLDLLQLGGQVDILDTPGVGSEDRFDSISAEVLRSLDAVVLVVRYPALFTQLTRKLMKGLESDIGKLFVVWNLDAACTELTPEERAQHAETLRARVVGAHELNLVDARAALRAAARGDRMGVVSSGLQAFREVLSRFAASEKRQIVALREAAKRAEQWLNDAQQALTRRKNELDSLLTATRKRLQGVRDAADAKNREARGQFESFQNSVAGIAEQRAMVAAANAAAARKQLRAARRRWIRAGDFEAVEHTATMVAAAYADSVEKATGATMQSLRDAARRFGTVIPATPRGRCLPVGDPIASDERKQRAAEGRALFLRRVVWRRWYLPGLSALEHQALDADLASQAAWFDAAARGAEEAARMVLEARLAEIARQADAEARQIKAGVRFEECETEFEELGRHLPEVSEQRERVGRINAEARELME
jgi:hypothetical protein